MTIPKRRCSPLAPNAPEGSHPSPQPRAAPTEPIRRAAPSPQWLDDAIEPAAAPKSEGKLIKAGTRPRRSKKAPTGDHEVGYCRPPTHTRFQPGNRANPRGRPRGSKNMLTLIREKLDDKHPVTINGRSMMMSKREMGVTKCVNKFAETGDLKYALALFRLEGHDGSASLSDRLKLADEGEPMASDADVLGWYRDGWARSTPEAETESPDQATDGEDVP